jgi:thiol:disulfide interchange protein
MQIKTILNLILVCLAAYSIYLIWTLPQPYGLISLAILTVTSLFNFIRNKKVFIPLYALGIGGSISILIAAYTFTSYTEQQRDQFNIPMAVKFDKDDFNSALKKATKENKPIFIDFYTGWCVPCLKFTKTVLTDEEVGRHMNSAFINLKYDAEKGEGIALAKRFNVTSYPTLLIVNKHGKVLENLMKMGLPDKADMIRLSLKYETRKG